MNGLKDVVNAVSSLLMLNNEIKLKVITDDNILIKIRIPRSKLLFLRDGFNSLTIEYLISRWRKAKARMLWFHEKEGVMKIKNCTEFTTDTDKCVIEQREREIKCEEKGKMCEEKECMKCEEININAKMSYIIRLDKDELEVWLWLTPQASQS